MATIKDVANTAGVSPATVSAVLNDSAFVSPALKARVLDAVRDLGTPLPVIVIAEMIGIPPQDRDRFKQWSDVLADRAKVLGRSATRLA